MMKIAAACFTFFAFFALLPSIAGAQTQRTVTVEWDALTNAKTYEIEFLPDSSEAKPLIFQTTAPEWSGTLDFGNYQMRIRGKDRRKAPGAWSAYEEFKVLLEPAGLISPASSALIKSNEDVQTPINFQWNSVVGAQTYLLQVFKSDGSLLVSKITDKTDWTAEIPVAASYTWKVQAQNTSIANEKISEDRFTVWGQKLQAPIYQAQDGSSGVNWQPTPYAQSYDCTLERKHPDLEQWVKVGTFESLKEPHLDFKKEWIGGTYKVTTVAKAPLRPPSPSSEVRFMIRDANRQLASEESFTLQTVLDRPTGWFARAQYMVTMLNYSSSDLDSNGSAKLTGLSGTARLGAGFLSHSSPWGFVMLGDFSGLTVGSHNYTYSRFELSAIRRKSSESTESRHIFGLFTQELPILASRASGTESVDPVIAAGPHYGYEHTYYFTNRMGIQGNFHTYFNFYKVRTPNQQPISVSPSLQLGLLGSYQIASNTTGFFGYTMKYDSIQYRSLSSPTENNKVELNGHYLNFFLEWAL